jgi:hypothetical protein
MAISSQNWFTQFKCKLTFSTVERNRDKESKRRMEFKEKAVFSFQKVTFFVRFSSCFSITSPSPDECFTADFEFVHSMVTKVFSLITDIYQI